MVQLSKVFSYIRIHKTVNCCLLYLLLSKYRHEPKSIFLFFLILTMVPKNNHSCSLCRSPRFYTDCRLDSGLQVNCGQFTKIIYLVYKQKPSTGPQGCVFYTLIFYVNIDRTDPPTLCILYPKVYGGSTLTTIV